MCLRPTKVPRLLGCPQLRPPALSCDPTNPNLQPHTPIGPTPPIPLLNQVLPAAH